MTRQTSPMRHRNRRHLVCAIVGAWLVTAAQVHAQGVWPTGPIRLVVPYGPGSTPDIVGRLLAERLQQALGQPVIVDNRVGAAGQIGTEYLARAAPDGQTLLLAVSTIAIGPSLRKLPYDVRRDLAPVMLVISGSYVLLARPGLGIENLDQLVVRAKRQPGQLTYGSFGPGSQVHLAMEMLKSALGIDLVHVPYKSLANAMQALLAGEIDLSFDATVSALPQVRAGRVKPLAVGGLQAVAALPGVPTIASVVPGYDADGWEAIFAPAGTAPEIIARLNAELRRITANPATTARFRELGFETRQSTPAELAALVESDLAKWAKVVHDNKIQVE